MEMTHCSTEKQDAKNGECGKNGTIFLHEHTKQMCSTSLITLGPIILWRQRCHAAIASIQTLLARHLSEEVALAALAIVMSRQIVTVVIVSGRGLFFVRTRCCSTGNNIARYKWHEFNCTNFSGVHFLWILVLQHFLDNVQPQCARRWNAQIVIEGKIPAFARLKSNQQFDGRFGNIPSLAIEDVWRTARLG